MKMEVDPSSCPSFSQDCATSFSVRNPLFPLGEEIQDRNEQSSSLSSTSSSSFFLVPTAPKQSSLSSFGKASPSLSSSSLQLCPHPPSSSSLEKQSSPTARENEKEEEIEEGCVGKSLSKKPKKGAYRQRAHCNPLADSYIVYPRNPDFVDWSLHFPAFFSSPSSSPPPLSSSFQEREKDSQSLRHSQERHDGRRSSPLYLNTDQYPVSYPRRQPSYLNGSSAGGGASSLHRVEFVDVGCGYGGLLVSLAPKFPNVLMLGMEIREKVTNYVGERIDALREQHAATGKYSNISVIRTNAMKYLVNYIRKGQLSKMFFCFPDPHFKRSNWRRRIINYAALSLYAYVLRPGGLLYTVTDVEELHKWMRQSCLLHPLFEELSLNSSHELQGDVCIQAIENETEEGMKVKRMGQPCFTCVFRRKA